MSIRASKHVTAPLDAELPDKRTRKGIHAPLPAILIGANPFFKEGLRSVLLHKVRVIADLETTQDLERLDHVDPQAVVIVDCATEGDIAQMTDGASKLRERNPALRVIVLANPDLAGVSRLVTLGAANVVVRRDISRETVIKLIGIVAEGFTIVSDDLLSWSEVPRPAPLPLTPITVSDYADDRAAFPSRRTLSERETAILRCLVDGASNKAIARRLSIAEATVKIHVKGVLRKISVANRTQAAIWALTHPNLAQPSAEKGGVAPLGMLNGIAGANGHARPIEAVP